MYIPKKLRHHFKAQVCQIDQLGMSKSHVMICSDFVFKRNPKNINSNEENSYIYLKEYIHVPHIIASHHGKVYEYLVMTKISGKMLIDPYFNLHPKEGIKILARGLKELWNVPIKDCQVIFRLNDKIKIAYQNLVNKNYDIDPSVFNDPRFPNPEALYQWLESNQPKEELVFTHGDYCLPNIFINDKNEIGFIDMDRSGVACKWQDIALCLRSIKYNYGDHQDLVDLFFKELGITLNEELIEYYILLDEFF